MALETGTYISDLNPANPEIGDPKKLGDDHLRLIKDVIVGTFTGITGEVTCTHTELNLLTGATVSTAEINILDGVTATTAEINKLDGVTATTAEINYVDGVTSNVQTQLNSLDSTKADLASPALTGNPTAPTQTAGDNSTRIATTAFVINTSFSAAVPVVVGDSGKVFGNDGSVASWTGKIVVDANQFIDLADATKQLQINLSGLSTGTTRTVSFPNASGQVVLDSAGQTLTSKVIPIDDDNLTIRDNGDTTKTAQFQASGISTGTQRVFTFANNNAVIDTPGWRLLTVTTFASDSTVDLEWANGTYDNIVILGKDVVIESATLDRFQLLFKIGGAYVTASNYNVTGRNFNIGSTSVDVSQSSQPHAVITSGTLNINNAVNPAVMRFDIANPADSTEHIIKSDIRYHTNAANAQAIQTYSHYNSTGVLSGIRLHTFSNLAISGTFQIFGIRSAF